MKFTLVPAQSQSIIHLQPSAHYRRSEGKKEKNHLKFNFDCIFYYFNFKHIPFYLFNSHFVSGDFESYNM